MRTAAIYFIFTVMAFQFIFANPMNDHLNYSYFSDTECEDAIDDSVPFNEPGARFFIKDQRWGQYIYQYNGSIHIDADGPEQWEVRQVPGKANTYHIIYRARDMYWKKQSQDGQYLTPWKMNPQDGPNRLYYLLRNTPSEWIIVPTGNDRYRVTSRPGPYTKGMPFLGNWIMKRARDQKRIQLTALPVQHPYQNVKGINYREFNSSIHLAKIGDTKEQTPAVSLKLKVNAMKKNGDKPYLSVSLAGSGVSANDGNPNINADSWQKRNWFLDYIEVKMTAKDKNGKILAVSKSSPQKEMKGGSISYFNSTSFKIGGTAGANSNGPVGLFNGELSETWGQTGTYELREFNFTPTDLQPLLHEYQMGMTSRGTPYFKAADLVYKPSIFHQSTLSGIPGYARGYFKILSSALFTEEDGKRMDMRNVSVKVEIRFTLSSADLTGSDFSFGYANYEVVRDFDLDLSSIF